MNILYLTEHPSSRADGVTQKVQNQVSVWEDMGHRVKALLTIPGAASTEEVIGIEKGAKADFFPRPEFVAGVMKRIEEFAPDVVYMRFPRYRGVYARIMDAYPTILEMNTLDVQEKRAGVRNGPASMKSLIRLRATRGKILKRAAGLVGVTREIIEHPSIAKYRKPSTYIPNSIDLTGKQALPPANHEDGNLVPVIVFIGTQHGAVWQGVDELLDLARTCDGELEFRVIGTELPEGVESLGNVEHFPLMTPVEYREVFRNADVGLGTCALYRKEMEEACPLKIREYVAHGLPVILPYRDTAFIDQEELPWWALEVPNKSGALLAARDKILTFCQSVMGRRLVPEEATNNFGSAYWERKRLDFLAKCGGGSTASPDQASTGSVSSR